MALALRNAVPHASEQYLGEYPPGCFLTRTGFPQPPGHILAATLDDSLSLAASFFDLVFMAYRCAASFLELSGAHSHDAYSLVQAIVMGEWASIL